MRVRVVVSLDGAIVTEVELTKPVSVVGRHSACDICIDHPAISGRHMLFRVVGQTVYVEDLASTNGTKVNGHATQHQVVHHLDLIEVGHHKLHFFDDDLLSAGAPRTLETTIHTDFEKTMMVGHAPAAAEPAAPPVLTQGAPRRDEELSRTMAMPAFRGGRVDNEPATHSGSLALRCLSGMHAGEVVSLEKANTMLGAAGADSALVVRRGEGYFLARFGGAAPRLNRKELEPGAHRIGPRDLIEVGNSRYEVIAANP
jgi:pSer/pThr/pTyr-binding forkhead associated (FHA) protein